MSGKRALVVIVCALVATCTAFADTSVVGTYAGDTWTYNLVTDDEASTKYFYVYLDPAMDYNYMDSIGNDGSWANPGSLTTVTSGPYTGLKYLRWGRLGGSTNDVNFYFSDANYDLGGGQYMDLIDHPGPLLGDSGAWSTGWANAALVQVGYTTRADGHTVANPVVPEPGTMVLLGLGLVGLRAAVRRRRK